MTDISEATRPAKSVQRHPCQPSRATHLSYDNRVYLNTGDRVLIRHRRDAPRTGMVDDVSEDASVFWVWLDDGLGRVMVCGTQDVTIWRIRPD